MAPERAYIVQHYGVVCHECAKLLRTRDPHGLGRPRIEDPFADPVEDLEKLETFCGVCATELGGKGLRRSRRFHIFEVTCLGVAGGIILGWIGWAVVSSVYATVETPRLLEYAGLAKGLAGLASGVVGFILAILWADTHWPEV